MLVYDLGGGTFDVALLRREGDTFEHQIEPAGIERLGGIDFDEAVFQYVSRHDPAEVLEAARAAPRGRRRPSPSCAGAASTPRRRCRRTPRSDVPVMLPGLHGDRAHHPAGVRGDDPPDGPPDDRSSSRAPSSGRTCDPSSLGAVLLVGGSSRIPLVPQMVAEQLGLPVRVDAHPKLVVAKGAARRAGLSHSRAGRPRPSRVRDLRRRGGRGRAAAAAPAAGRRRGRPCWSSPAGCTGSCSAVTTTTHGW